MKNCLFSLLLLSMFACSSSSSPTISEAGTEADGNAASEAGARRPDATAGHEGGAADTGPHQGTLTLPVADGGASSSHDFGTVNVGETISAAFTLHNAGTTAVHFSSATLGAFTGAAATDFATALTAPVSDAGLDALASSDGGEGAGSQQAIAPGASRTFYVVFEPSATGTRAATLTLASDAPSSPSVRLTGKGVCPTAAPVHFERPGVAAACGKGIFIATGNLTQRLVSTDAVTWTDIVDDRTDPNGMATGCLTCDDDAFYASFSQGLVVVGSESGIYTSADGAKTWKKAAAPAPTGIVAGGGPHVAASAYGNGFFIVANGENTYKSFDGYTWTLTADGNPSTCNQFGRGALVFGNGHFFAICGAVSSAPNTTGQIYKTTEDGLTWHDIVTTTTNAYLDATFGDGQFLAVGTGFHATSKDAATWVVTHDQCTDPSTWTGADSGCLGGLSHTIYDGSKFLACGNRGCFTSKDAVTWTRTFTSSISNLLTSGNGLYLLNQGSKDIVTNTVTSWSAAPSTYPTTNYIERVSFGEVLK